MNHIREVNPMSEQRTTPGASAAAHASEHTPREETDPSHGASAGRENSSGSDRPDPGHDQPSGKTAAEAAEDEERRQRESGEESPA